VRGVGRGGASVEELGGGGGESMAHHGGGIDEAVFAKLAARLRMVGGRYEDAATFAALRKELGDVGRPAHSLAIPPSLFATVVDGLAASGCSEGARVILEKPFGRDLASAQALNATLHRVFDESAIFPVDHS